MIFRNERINPEIKKPTQENRRPHSFDSNPQRLSLRSFIVMMLFATFMSLVVFLFPRLCSSRLPVCGDGVCEVGETDTTCREDCCPSVWDVEQLLDPWCLSSNGNWSKLLVPVEGRPRTVLYAFPHDRSEWTHGAIVLLHGGGGVASSWCFAAAPENQAFPEVSRMALEQGFAVFALNSLYNVATDPTGLGAGKRWDTLKMDRPNVDIAYFEKVLADIIPLFRPAGSSPAVFLAGISCGGYMSTYVASRLSHLIHGFAPAASGDPYGIYWNMSTPSTRECSPGAWIDIETRIEIGVSGACNSSSGYPNELPWPEIARKVPFMQFQHGYDCGNDVSCMWKTNYHLKKAGFVEYAKPMVLDRDSDPIWIPLLDWFSVDRGYTCHLEDHYWQTQFTQPLLDFFKDAAAFDCFLETLGGCGDHGTCVFADECLCDDGWTGAQCQLSGSATTPGGSSLTVGLAIGIPTAIIILILGVLVVVLAVIVCCRCSNKE